jgi:energy-coupling factor transporter ATP-binding protein EcfA2
VNVILEGPDGGGKSTLAAHLAGALDMRVQGGSGPPKSTQEIVDRANAYLKMTDVVFDRHPCVSQPIYGAMRGDPPAITHELLKAFYDSPQLIIYCRSESSHRHVVKPGENPEHVEKLTTNYQKLISHYDAWALTRAHLVYRIGDPLDQLTDIVRVVAG